MRARFTWHHRRKVVFVDRGLECYWIPVFNWSYGNIAWLFWELWWFDEGVCRWD